MYKTKTGATPLDEEISYFANAKDAMPKKIRLRDFLFPREEEKAAICALVGKVRAATSREEGNDLKRQLPAATLSVVCEGGRKSENIVRRTPFVCLDVDGPDHSGGNSIGAEEMKMRIMQVAHVVYCSVSAGGKGCFAIVLVDDPSAFEENIKELEWCFKNALGLKVDGNCKDATHLRFASYDPAAYLNEGAIPFKASGAPLEIPVGRNGRNDNGGDDGDGDDGSERAAFNDAGEELRKAEAYVAELERLGIDIAPEREQWCNVGFALHTLGDEGIDLFRRVSALWSKGTTTEKDLRAFWRSVKTDEEGISMGTFYQYCHDAGVDPCCARSGALAGLEGLIFDDEPQSPQDAPHDAEGPQAAGGEAPTPPRPQGLGGEAPTKKRETDEERYYKYL